MVHSTQHPEPLNSRGKIHLIFETDLKSISSQLTLLGNKTFLAEIHYKNYASKTCDYINRKQFDEFESVKTSDLFTNQSLPHCTINIISTIITSSYLQLQQEMHPNSSIIPGTQQTSEGHNLILKYFPFYTLPAYTVYNWPWG